MAVIDDDDVVEVFLWYGIDQALNIWVLPGRGRVSMANSYSCCHRQLVESAAVGLPSEMAEICSPLNAFATDFSWRLAT